MVERPTDAPLPPAHPAAGGAPPLPDGDQVPQPPRPAQPALTRRQLIYGWTCVAIVLVALVVGVLRQVLP